MENQELNKTQIEVTINKPTRVLHFCDGVDEEIEEQKTEELNSASQTGSASASDDNNVDPKTLSWAPWFSYYAWKSGSKMLNAVDYAGEGLAGFFGITTPKYQIEINEYERVQAEKKKLDDESAGWLPNNAGGNIPLVLNEPCKAGEKPQNV